ncbi:MAG: hypothetical protein OEY61_12975 [Gammaproteobacteria bacterium]|nr:hypothetical protein [Gammaproteobacteria bacterium]
MRLLRISILIFVVLATVSVRAESINCTNGLLAQVTFKKSASIFMSSGLVHIKGTAVLANNTNKALSFSTSYLIASFGKQAPVRGYKDTLASEAIDISSITLKPGEAIKVNMYWPFEGESGEEVLSAKVSCAST